MFGMIAPAVARPAPAEAVTNRAPAVAPTNSPTQDGHWHIVNVVPPDHPKIRTIQKFNPLWWFKNADDPKPPADYQPTNPHRNLNWSVRNLLHNFTFYVIGVADKKVTRAGRYPKAVMNPRGAFNLAVTFYGPLPLPFFSYHRRHFNFYLGWRERGNFGIKLNFHSSPKPPTPEPQYMPLPRPSANPFS